jgi:5-methyltetrahydrofolate--homocysteine methyltransferase
MDRAQLATWLAAEIRVYDGAMGTMLARAPREAWCPDELSLSRPGEVAAVHRGYLAAGADIIQTNTFGANWPKLSHHGLAGRMADINRQAAALARQAVADCGRPALVAGSIGPTGKLLRPYGDLDPRECYAAFLSQAAALAAAGVDILCVETMSDILEAKLAVLAAKTAAPGLPVFGSLTYDSGQRTLTGADPETAAVSLEALGADVIGVNCGGAPGELAAALSQLATATTRPLIVRPNAGLPCLDAEGRAVWQTTPAEMAAWAARYGDLGAGIIGGCCGTTPDHIAAMAAAVRGRAPARRSRAYTGGSLAGSGKVVLTGGSQPVRMVGERLNPTSRPELQAALAAGDWAFVASDALAQVDAGADLLDINVGHPVPGKTEAELMAEAVLAVQKAVAVPISLDSTDPAAIESGLFVARGKPLINSTTADPDGLSAMMELARRYGASIVGLPMSGGKIPQDAGGRVALARRIVEAAAAAGVPAGDVYIDGLALAASVHVKHAGTALATIAAARSEFGAGTILGVSNISHGLPGRDHLNSAYLAMAVAQGLDLVIANPLAKVLPGVMHAAGLLAGRDHGARRFTAWATQAGADHRSPGSGAPGTAPDGAAALGQAPSPSEALVAAVSDGDSFVGRRLCVELVAASWSGTDIVDRCVIPGLERIGAAYEARRAFLPQLLLAAEAAQAVLRTAREADTGAAVGAAPVRRAPLGRVLIATVQGDMHDIGKSIVALMLESHGFVVRDMGRDVAADAIVAAAEAEGYDLVALSALMTTTMPEMGRTVEALRRAGLDVPVLVGGAVVSASYAASIGAAYASDAVAGVRAAKELVRKAQ